MFVSLRISWTVTKETYLAQNLILKHSGIRISQKHFINLILHRKSNTLPVVYRTRFFHCHLNSVRQFFGDTYEKLRQDDTQSRQFEIFLPHRILNSLKSLWITFKPRYKIILKEHTLISAALIRLALQSNYKWIKNIVHVAPTIPLWYSVFINLFLPLSPFLCLILLCRLFIFLP